MGPASKCQGPLLGRGLKESSRVLCRTLFGEEPEKQRAEAPQDAGKTPSACLSQPESTWLRSNENDSELETRDNRKHCDSSTESPAYDVDFG